MCREHNENTHDDDCCGYDYETWCADGYTMVRGSDDEGTDECWPGAKGYLCIPYEYISCRSCQNGCGGYCPDTTECLVNGDEQPDTIAATCLEDAWTTIIDGETYGVCDSDGVTPWTGQPCTRD